MMAEGSREMVKLMMDLSMKFDALKADDNKLVARRVGQVNPLIVLILGVDGTRGITTTVPTDLGEVKEEGMGSLFSEERCE